MSKTKPIIELDLPCIRSEVRGMYTDVKRPTGLEYALLTMLGTASGHMTWQELIGEFGLPEEMFGWFRDILISMRDRRMIDSSGTFEIREEISLTEMTSDGRKAFEKNVVYENPESFRTNVCYFPAETEKNRYTFETSIKFFSESPDASHYSDVRPNENLIENYVRSNCKDLGIKPENEMFDIDIESENGLQYVRRKVHLDFDESTGGFSVSDAGLDETFLKGRFTASDILRRLPEQTFESRFIRSDVPLSEEPEWDSCFFRLPCDIDFANSKLIASNTEIDVTGTIVVRGSDASIIAIDSSASAIEYRFITKRVKLSGFDGTLDAPLAICRRIGAEDIKKVIAEAFGSLELSDADDLQKAAAISVSLKDSGYIKQAIHDSMAGSNPSLVLSSMALYSSQSWYRDAAVEVENGLCDGNRKTFDEIVSILKSCSFKIDGTVLAISNRSENPSDNLSKFDRVEPVVNDHLALVDAFGVRDEVASIILNGTDVKYVSQVMQSAINIHSNLDQTKTALNMESLNKYSFDLENVDEVLKKSVVATASTYIRELDRKGELIKGSSVQQELVGYRDFFSDVCDMFNSESGKRAKGVELGRKSESILKSIGFEGDLKSMIAQAVAEGSITQKDGAVLNEIRIFRNTCAHDVPIVSGDEKKIGEWSDYLRELIGRIVEEMEK